MKKIYKIILVIAVASLGSFLQYGIAEAASVTPENTNTTNGRIWHTVSNGELRTTNGTNLLYAPRVDLKIIASQNGGFRVIFYGGGQCNTPGYDSGVNGPKVTQFRVRSSTATGSPNMTDGLIAQTDNGGGCSAENIVLNIPAGKSKPLRVAGQEDKFVFYVSATIPGASTEVNGYLNVFQVATEKGDIGPAKSDVSSRPVAYLGRPANDLEKDYYLKFGAPCSHDRANRVTISWFDADYGTDYQSKDIFFQLVDKTDGANTLMKTTTKGGTSWPVPSGSTGVPAGLAKVEKNDLGGEGIYKHATYIMEPGHQYEWQWRNVSNRNGVQVYYPFDAIDYYVACDDDQGQCEPPNGSAIQMDSTVSPGQRNVAVKVKIKNTGGQDWNAGNHYLNIPNDDWSDIKSEFNGINLVSGRNIKMVFGNYPPYPDPNSVIEFNFTVTAPLAVNNGISNFGVSILRGDPNKSAEEGTIIGSCARDIEVKANQPFLRVSGGDVRAGAQFEGVGLQCGVGQSGALAADINTSGYWGSSGEGVNLISFNGISSSQYAVLATGLVGSSGNNNFAGNNAIYPRELRKDLTFANTGNDSDSYGNFYSGSSAYCQNVSSLWNNDATEELEDGSTFSKTNFRGSKIYKVNGDLTLGDISYKDLYNSVGEVPQLTIIVQGNIYIPSSVSRLDGTFIAIPNADGTGGVIDTCSNFGDKGKWQDSGGGGLKLSDCSSQLVVNGRLIARDVIWKRTHGTIGIAAETINSSCAVGEQAIKQGLPFIDALEDCAAEFINMTPEVYFGSDETDSRSSSNVSNVPVSSIELPPIY